MAHTKKVMFGGALVAGALLSGSGQASSAIGDSVIAELSGGTKESNFGELLDPFVRQCVGTEFDERQAGSSFRVAFPADCFNGYQVATGGGYGELPLPGPTEVVTSIEIQGEEVAIRLPAELRFAGESSEQIGELYRYESSVSGCSTLFIELMSDTADDPAGSVDFRRDLTCDSPIYDISPFSVRLTSPINVLDDGFFGYSVDVGANNFVIGEPGSEFGDPTRGRVWAYDRIGDRSPTLIEPSQYLGGPDDSSFGRRVATNPDGVVAVTEVGVTPAIGAALHIFTPDGEGGYTEQRFTCVPTECGGNVEITDGGTIFSGQTIWIPDGPGSYQVQSTADNRFASVSQNGQFAVGLSFDFDAEPRTATVKMFRSGSGGGYIQFASMPIVETDAVPITGLGRWEGVSISNDGTAVVTHPRDTRSEYLDPRTAGGLLHVFNLDGTYSHQIIEMPTDLPAPYSFPHSVAFNRNGDLVTRAESTSNTVQPLILRYKPSLGGGYELDEVHDPTNNLQGFVKGDVLDIFDNGVIINSDFLDNNNEGEAYVFIGEGGKRGSFLSGPLGTGISPTAGTFVVADTVPSDPAYPECLANFSYPDEDVPRVCFSSGEREIYIDALLEVDRPDGEIIWIGRFDEEAVAP